MKIKLVRTAGPPHGYLTVGYWMFEDRVNNKGVLTIEVAKLPDWRMGLAVIGHELLEALYCKVRGISTIACDDFDDWAETQYAQNIWPKTFEAGFFESCPYRIGHVIGSYWERFIITVTFANWRLYDQACNRVMGIT